MTTTCDSFEAFVIERTGRDIAYHIKHETLGVGVDSFAFACWKKAKANEQEKCAALADVYAHDSGNSNCRKWLNKLAAEIRGSKDAE